MKSVGEIIRGTPSYRQLLGTAEWKSFSASIRRERGGACECCHRKDIETQVHHISYEPGKHPADYGQDVVLLCVHCHEALHAELKRFRKIVFRKCEPQAFRALNTALAIGLRVSDPLKFAYAVMEMACSPHSVENFCNYWINRPEKDRPTLEEDKLTR